MRGRHNRHGSKARRREGDDNGALWRPTMSMPIPPREFFAPSRHRAIVIVAKEPR